MSVHVKCDRCGKQTQTSGVMLFAGLTGPAIPTARPELPDGWRRPRIPHEDGSSWDRELCPACMSDLTRFMEGCPVGDKPARDCPGCGHLDHFGAACREQVMPGPPGDVGECGCAEGTSTDD